MFQALGPTDRPCEARRPAAAFQGDLGALVGRHLRPPSRVAPGSPGFREHHDARARPPARWRPSTRTRRRGPPRTRCRARAALAVTAPASAANRRRRGLGPPGLRIDIRWNTSAGPRQCGSGTTTTSLTRRRAARGAGDALVVRPISAAHRDRPLVEPHDVAAFDLSGRLDRADDGQAERVEQRPARRARRGARLSHAAEHEAARASRSTRRARRSSRASGRRR